MKTEKERPGRNTYTAQNNRQSPDTQCADSNKQPQEMKSQCSKRDYISAIAVGVGAAGIDIFGVGQPGKSLLGNKVDRGIKFLITGCGKKSGTPVAAIRNLEKRFAVPYDHRGVGDAGSCIPGLTPSSHHFLSHSHNPTWGGFASSIRDQMNGTSSFISGGNCYMIQADGWSFPDGKKSLTAAVFRYFGHLRSDIAGSSGSTGRGMGIPGQLLSIVNDIVALKNRCGLGSSAFDCHWSEIAEKIFEDGFDLRYELTQSIPVLFIEFFVRLCYFTTRWKDYCEAPPKEERSLNAWWNACKPVSNDTVQWMLAIAYSVFFVLDVTDAATRAILKHNPLLFIERLNGIGLLRCIMVWLGVGINHIKKCVAKHKTKNTAAVHNTATDASFHIEVIASTCQQYATVFKKRKKSIGQRNPKPTRCTQKFSTVFYCCKLQKVYLYRTYSFHSSFP